MPLYAGRTDTYMSGNAWSHGVHTETHESINFQITLQKAEPIGAIINTYMEVPIFHTLLKYLYFYLHDFCHSDG